MYCFNKLKHFQFWKASLSEKDFELVELWFYKGKKAEWGSVVYERVKNRLNIFDNSFLSITFVK